ncbi:MAG: hypothetical protein GX782_11450 [Gammaproteobacteria bacterium]|nr:hypothetical protein [Gammaproteobacteria bacterium]
MGFIANFKGGRAMTKMVNLMEEAERNRKTLDITGDMDLYEARWAQIEQELNQSIEYLRRFPRHIVTENLIKNVRIASRFGDNKRIVASNTVLAILVEEGVALDLDTFEKSFVR